MEIKLSGLQDVTRVLDARVNDIIRRSHEVILNEVESLKSAIASRLGSLGGDLDLSVNGNEITLSLLYKGGKTARWQHNPTFWDKYGGSKGISLHQPFQDELTLRGYTNISPGRGDPIEPSKPGIPPNVRITATLPDHIVKEITR